jgi:hypothetical protein
MDSKNRGPPARSIWAYGYEISPPMPSARMRSLERLLESERSNAKREARTWSSRFVVDERVTHILVVSDSADQGLDINRKLELELARLNAAYSVSPPVPVADEWETG